MIRQPGMLQEPMTQQPVLIQTRTTCILWITLQNKQPKIQRSTVISRYQRPTMIPRTRQQWRVFLVWQSGPYQRKMRGNPESRLFQQLKCTVRQSFLQLKLPIRVLPLYIKRCSGLNPVTMLVYVTRLVVFTTRVRKNQRQCQQFKTCLLLNIQNVKIYLT